MQTKSIFHELQETALQQATRRHFLQGCTTGLGSIWLGMQTANAAGDASRYLPQHAADNPLSPLSPPLPGRAKRIIYLHMIGAPSQLELFDDKPDLQLLDGK